MVNNLSKLKWILFRRTQKLVNTDNDSFDDASIPFEQKIHVSAKSLRVLEENVRESVR